MADRSECSVVEMDVTELEEPRVNWMLKYIYEGTGYLMRKIISTVPDPTIQRVAKVVDDPKEIRSVILDSAVENPIIFIVFLVWMLLAGFMVFLAGMNFACRALFARKPNHLPFRSRVFSKGRFLCGCGPRAEQVSFWGKPLSGLSVFWAALSFIICVVTSCYGMFIFSTSLLHLRNGIELLPKQVQIVSKDVSTFTKNLRSTVQCLYDEEYEAFDGNSDHRYRSMMAHVEVVRTSLSQIQILQIIAFVEYCEKDFENLKKQLRPLTVYKPFEQASKKLQQASAVIAEVALWALDVLAVYDVTLEQINKSVNESKVAMKQVLKSIEEHGEELTEALNSIRNFTVTLQQQLADIFTKEDHSQRVSSMLGYTIIIPITLVILSILGLTAISMSWAFYASRDRHDGRQSRRGAVSAVASSILATSGYSAMLIGALLCVMSAVCFIVAFLAMSICTGLFEDRELRLFHAIPNMEYVITIGSVEIRHTLYDTFYKCKNGYTFFEPLKGSQIMAEKEFRNKYSNLLRYDIGRQVQNFHVDMRFLYSVDEKLKFMKGALVTLNETLKNAAYQKLVKDQLPTLKMAIKEADHHLNLLYEHYIALRTLLEVFTSRKTRDMLVSALRENQSQLQKLIFTAIANLYASVTDFSPQCGNLLVIWNGLGKYVCRWIAEPAQGLWVACMFCAVGSIAIYHAFFNTARFLQDYAESTRQLYRHRRRRRKKYKYVLEALKQGQMSKSKDILSELSKPRSQSVSRTSAVSQETVSKSNQSKSQRANNSKSSRSHRSQKETKNGQLSLQKKPMEIGLEVLEEHASFSSSSREKPKKS
ncbi:hypothetical protein Y032_0203g1809 [Ancylostoma ceylanicum]|uniref:Uncharacterized protein n=2 Tax=Ancylostoma ceylanicum TaxID=53326 RepID=A0A016SMV6_9BILA|nr:hypothetical protein Y032_0203g1809 [Ancylostoma ceylanicum]